MRPPSLCRKLPLVAGVIEAGVLVGQHVALGVGLEAEHWLAHIEALVDRAEDPTSDLRSRLASVADASRALDALFLLRVAATEEPPALDDSLALVATARALMNRCASAFAGQLLPALRDRGVLLLSPWDLPEPQRDPLDEFFKSAIFPLLTPMSVDSGRPFPQIANLSLNIATLIEDLNGRTKFVRIEVPRNLPRFLRPCEANVFVPVEECIAANLHHVLHGARVHAHHAFRVTRRLRPGAVSEPSGLAAAPDSQRPRQVSRPVRLEVDAAMPPQLVDFLVERLTIPESLAHAVPGPIDLIQASSLLITDGVMREPYPRPQVI
jgi:polyphosphate kinase